MPDINVVIWNIENFGEAGKYGNSVSRCNFIARAISNADADIVLIQEWKGSDLQRRHVRNQLLIELNSFGQGDWFCDSIPGAVLGPGHFPFNLRAHLGFTTPARSEGYLLYWKLNIAKFIMQPADPIDQFALSPNLMNQIPPHAQFIQNMQSDGVIYNFQNPFGQIVQNLLNPIQVPQIPGAGSFILPTGFNQGNIIRAGQQVMSQQNLILFPNDRITAGTQIGLAGLIFNQQIFGLNPNIIPGNYTLTDDLILPAVGEIIVPKHVLSLVLTGRMFVPDPQNANFEIINNFNPNNNNQWGQLLFPNETSRRYAHGFRTPASCTIKVNSQGQNNANRLIPITVYHAPAASKSAHAGTHRASLCRTLYQAFDHINNDYIDCNRALIGGDWNIKLGDPILSHFTNNFANGGANCQIRVNRPALNPPPAFPPNQQNIPDHNPENKSIINLDIRPFQAARGRKIISNQNSHYRGKAIDNIFYRGFNLNQAPEHDFSNIYFLIDAVSGIQIANINSLIPSNIIVSFQNLIQRNIPDTINVAELHRFVTFGGFGNIYLPNRIPPIRQFVVGRRRRIQNLPGVGATLYISPDPNVNLDNFIIPVERLAAEFVKKFVSDHLPVLFRMHL